MDVHDPNDVIPPKLAEAVANNSDWFIIGGQAVRCFSPYRPSRDVDFGVTNREQCDTLVRLLKLHGSVDILEQNPETVHLLFDGIKVSIFVLGKLASHVENRHLDVTGVLASKLHEILDRGMRRDFFDLYVIMEQHVFGIAECLSAMHTVFGTEANEHLLLRALTYFGDADREAPLPGEGPDDWKTVKSFFRKRVGHLLIPPSQKLAIQKEQVDLNK